VKVPFAKWPMAIQQLINRTQIHQVGIHLDIDLQPFLDSNPTVFPHLIDIFNQNHSKFTIEMFEFVIRSLDRIPSIQPFVLCCLQLSIPHLKEFHLRVWFSDRKEFMSPIWSIIKDCNKLETIDVNDCDVTALLGKPLDKVTIIGYIKSVDCLAQVMNGITGDGIQSLNLGYIEFKMTDLCDRLTEKSRKRLKLLTVQEPIDSMFEILHLIPSMFPNLKRLNFREVDIKDVDAFTQV